MTESTSGKTTQGQEHSAHTQGPWREGQLGNMRVYGPDATDDDSGLIAIVFKGRANARLIAAAPDLLEALEAMLEGYEPEDHANRAEPNPDCPLCMAHAALARVSGTPPTSIESK